MDFSSDTLTFSIGASILDTIIGDMFFRDEEVLDDNSDDDEPEAIAKVAAKKAKHKINAMTLFVTEEDDPGRHKVFIKNVLRDEHAMDYVSIAMSFRQTSAAIQFSRDHTKATKLTCMNDLVSTSASLSTALCRTSGT
jgi:hypothetical protein